MATTNMASERKYCERFRRIFQQHRTTCGNNIDAFARSVNPRVLGFVDRSDFYAPVRFTVHLGESISDPGAAVAIEQHVYTHAPAPAPPGARVHDWVAELKSTALRMAGMDATPATLARTELRTMTGKPLAAANVQRPEAIGRLRLFVGGKQIKVAASALQAEPPADLRVGRDKRRSIERAMAGALRTLPNALASVLHNKRFAEVDEALQPGGLVERTVGEHIDKSLSASAKSSFAEFVRTHHAKPRLVASDARLAQGVLDQAKRRILRNVCRMVLSVEESIEQYTKQQALGDNALLGRRRADPVTANVANGHALYSGLVSDAVSPEVAPALMQALIDTVHEYRPPATAAAVAAAGGEARALPMLTHKFDRAHHPYHAMIHATLMPVRGAYPPAYMARLMAQQDMTAEAPYRGDADRTHVAFQLLAHLGSVPPPLIVKNGVPQPIAHHLPRRPRAREGAMGGKGGSAVESEMPALVDPPSATPAKSGMRHAHPVIYVDSEVACPAQPGDKKRAPPVLPVGDYYDSGSGDEMLDYMDARVAFPYTPQHDVRAIQAEMRARLVPIAIANEQQQDIDAGMGLQEDDEELPPVSDMYE